MTDWPEIASAPTKGRVDVEPTTGLVDTPLETTGVWPAIEVQPPQVTPPVHAAPNSAFGSAPSAPTQAGVALIDPPAGLDQRTEGDPTGGSGPVSVEDLQLEAATAPLSPRFRFEPVVERTDRTTSKKARLAQGTMLLGLVAAVAGFIVMLPDDGSSIESGEQARVETVDKPVATADMPDAAALPEIEGSLGETGGFGNLSAFAAPTPGTPADDGDSFDAMVAGVVEEAAPEQATTTTTTWVEPTLPPESEWVDAGNGFLVPDLLLRIRFCESTNNYAAANTTSSARGAYQFLNKSWDWYGHAARTGVAEAHLATPAQQDESALLTLQSQGTSPWFASRDCWADPNLDSRYATAAPPQPTTTTVVDDEETSDTSEGSDTSTPTEDSTPDTTAPESTTSSTESPDSTTSTTMDDTTTTTTDDSTTTTSAGS